VAQFAGDWNVTAYVSSLNYTMKCAKMNVASFAGDAGTTMNYRFDFFAYGKAQIGEGISYSKEVGKGASTYFVFKKETESKFSGKLTVFSFLEFKDGRLTTSNQLLSPYIVALRPR
jgi:hypothetical protein